MNPELTQYTLRFILTTGWADLPPEVQHQAKRGLLDGLGALLAGTQTPVGALMRCFARDHFGGKGATLLGSGERCSPVGAALANGFAGNALDIDDGYRRVKGHPGACVLPVALAAGETASSCSGPAFLAALTVGYEIGIRAGRIRHALYPTYHASGSWGAIAGAAVAAKLWGLDSQTLCHALGAAEYHAPIAPMMKGIAVPSMGKDGIGWGCMVGMSAALMAKAGFTGIAPLFAESPETAWIAELGQSYEILNLYFKPYAACRWAQPAVNGALRIQARFSVSPGDIRRIRVRTFAAATALSCQAPPDTEAAQYNMAFPIAAALIDGEVGPCQVLPPRLHDPAILSLAARVETELDPAYEAAFPARTHARVLVETLDGAILDSGLAEARWEPPESLPTDAELTAKFLGLTGPVLGDKGAKALAEQVWRAEKLKHMQTLIQSAVGS